MTPDKLHKMGIFLQYFGFLLCEWAKDIFEEWEAEQQSQGIE